QEVCRHFLPASLLPSFPCSFPLSHSPPLVPSSPPSLLSPPPTPGLLHPTGLLPLGLCSSGVDEQLGAASIPPCPLLPSCPPSVPSLADPAFFTRLGFSPPDFAAVAWMSSWALLGEGKGAGGVGEGGDGESMGRGEEGQAAGEEVGGTAAASSGVVPSAAAAVAAAKRNGTVVGKEGVEEDQPQEAAAEAEAEAASRPTPWFAQLSVEQKVQVGRACKLLIDAGRLEWLQGRGLGVEYVEYTTVDLTPENRMLLAVGSQEKQKDAFGSRLQ
ncbi:unnamed protein product, partial [Closterium sp. NIES-54]